jgi:regulator of sigma E protease
MEAIMRKPLSMRTKELWQQVGLFILASLMIFVFYNDLMRIFSKS